MPTDPHMVKIENAVRRRAWLRADGWRSHTLLAFMQAESIPGASMAVIDDGQVAWAKAYGVRQASLPDPVTEETLFQAASISKPVAALAALSLVQDGALALDEDINHYLVNWRIPPNRGWQPRVTLRQLLSHSAGVTVDGFPGYASAAPLPSLAHILNGEKPANTPPIMVDTLPGLHFRYSGGGFTILQQLLEDVTGQPFWQVSEERVLRPLGMLHSTYRCPLPPAWRTNTATGHRADGQPLAGGWHHYPESAAAGLWTTPLDLAQMLLEIDKSLAGSGERVISRALVAEMVKPHIRLRDLGLEGLEGLSLFLTEEEDGWYCGHGGSNEGYRAQFIIRKGKGQAAVIMTNADGGSELTNAWMGTVALEYGWTGFAYHPPTVLAIEPASLAPFPGRYRSQSGLSLEVRHSPGGVDLLVADQPALSLLPRSDRRFFSPHLNLEVAFTSPDVLVLRQNGEDLSCARMED